MLKGKNEISALSAAGQVAANDLVASANGDGYDTYIVEQIPLDPTQDPVSGKETFILKFVHQ